MKSSTPNLLIDKFITSTRNRGEAPALEVDGLVFSYQDLFQKALKISSAIKKAGSNQLTAVFAGKNISSFSGILGALLANAGYVPLNRKFPSLRNASMFIQSESKIIVAGPESLNELKQILPLIEEKVLIIIPEMKHEKSIEEMFAPNSVIFSEKEEADESICNELVHEGDKIAYLLFTSGSSGKPKGVAISNINVLTYISNLNQFGFTAADRFSQTFDLTFDLSIHDMFVCWSAGACLVVPPDDASPVLLASFVKQQKITCWFSVPSVAMLLMKTRLLKPESFPSLRYSFFCGESLSEKVVESWQEAAPHSEIINLYGPTETTIAISYYQWISEKGKNKCLNGIVPIGKIFNDHRYLLYNEGLNDNDKEGELLINGNQVTSGYWNDKIATTKQLTCINDVRWYKTGDIVMEDEDGNLHFLGRTDEQVKISGYRVELSEIDNTIRKAVNSPLVATVLNSSSQKLISFVTQGVDIPDEVSILNYCRKNLPSYMIPEKVLFIETMPLNVNGKIDKKQLMEIAR